MLELPATRKVFVALTIFVTFLSFLSAFEFSYTRELILLWLFTRLRFFKGALSNSEMSYLNLLIYKAVASLLVKCRKKINSGQLHREHVL